MKITNNLGLPEALVKLVSFEKHNKPKEISATTLLQGVREIILTDRHWNEITDDVSNRIWALFGTAVHSMLQQETPESFTEELFKHKTVNDITVTGRIDNYNMQTNTISDYKTASVWKWLFNDFMDWDTQGLVYAWLLRKNGFEINRIEFIAFLKDFSEKDAQIKPEYPQYPVMVHVVPMDYFEKLPWFDGGIEDWIISRIEQYVTAAALPDNDLPDCTSKEIWAKPAKYAVMNGSNQRALRVFDCQKDAETYLESCGKKDTRIEFRPGSRTKCERYCLAAPFCNTWKKSSAMEELNDLY